MNRRSFLKSSASPASKNPIVLDTLAKLDLKAPSLCKGCQKDITAELAEFGGWCDECLELGRNFD